LHPINTITKICSKISAENVKNSPPGPSHGPESSFSPSLQGTRGWLTEHWFPSSPTAEGSGHIPACPSKITANKVRASRQKKRKKKENLW